MKNLEYNLNNQFINLNEEDKYNFLKHIDQLKLKINEIVPFLKRHDLTNEDYTDLIQKVKKLLKINSKKYPMLIEYYDNEKNKDLIEESVDNLDKNQSKELNDKLNQIINDNIANINSLTKISKYTKKNIISYMNNLTYKLESITLDEQLFESYFL